MADIRINSLPSTATSFNTDDYIAIDGASGGTRKMLAATLPLTDVTLGGSSGPSVKSSLSARAPRQGLVFDGTAVTTSWAGNVLGTGDFTASAWIYIREQPAASQIKDIFSSTGGSAFALRVNTYGGFFFDVASTYSGGTNLIDATPYIGKWAHVVYSRSYSGTTTFYVNGVSAATRSPNDTTNYSGTTNTIGTNAFPGTITGTYLYNRALSASEVVALYEAGVPSGADYNSASNTSLLTGANSDFSSAGNWSVQGATTISDGKLNLSNGDAAYNGLAPLTVGKRYRLTITVDSLTAGLVQYYNGSTYVAFASAPGTYTVDFTCAATFAPGLHLRSSGGNAVLDTALYYPLGLLLAPDAAQAGGGLVWYDTSGNAANITLPASGVSWNVPTSAKVATGWQFGGNVGLGTSVVEPYISTDRTLQIHGGAYNATIKLTNNTSGTSGPADGAFALFNGSTFYLWNVENGPLSFGANNGEVGRFTASGNFLLKSDGVDGGQKLQVSGNGIFGNTTGASTTTPVNLSLGGTYGTTYANGIKLSVFDSGGTKHGLGVTSGVLYLATTDTATTIQLATNNTTALTLDGSQNATFAGDVFSTKSINIASGYSLTAQDSGNTYRTILRGIADNTVEIGWGTATPTNGHLIFKAGGTEQGRINPAGGWILGLTASAPVLGTNSTMTFELTSNTSLTIKVRGTDGTTRSATLTLS